MPESYHPRKTEKDVAESRYGTAKYDRKWKLGGGATEDALKEGVPEANINGPLNTEQLSNTFHFVEKPYTNDSVQSKVNEL